MEGKNQYIKLLENKIFERFQQESEIRKEIERRLSAVIEDKYNSLKIEISKESRNRFESIENLKTYLENDIPKLQGLVKFEQNERVENDNITLKKVQEELSKLQSAIYGGKKKLEKKLKRRF